LFSSAVPRMGVKAKRAGKTFMSMHCWIIWTASFSVSPKPMIRCVLTFSFPKILTASRNCLNWFCQMYGPFAAKPLTLSNSFCVAVSMGIAILFAPAFANRCMFSLFSGWHEIEIGNFVCCFIALMRAVRCWKTFG